MAVDKRIPRDPDPDDDAGANHVGAQLLSEADQFLANEILAAVQTVEELSDSAQEPLVNSPTPDDLDHDDNAGADHAGAQGQGGADQHEAEEPVSKLRTKADTGDDDRSPPP